MKKRTPNRRRTAALRELVTEMKELGLTSATLADGTSATFAATPKAPFQPPKKAAANGVPQGWCSCQHRLSRHTPQGECIERQANGAPCAGPCSINEPKAE